MMWTIALAGSLAEAFAGRLESAPGGTCDLVVTDRVRADLPRGRVLLVSSWGKSTVPELRNGLKRADAEVLVLLPRWGDDALIGLLEGLEDAPDVLAALIAGLDDDEDEYLIIRRDELDHLSPDSPWLRSEDAQAAPPPPPSMPPPPPAPPSVPPPPRPSIRPGGSLIVVDRERPTHARPPETSGAEPEPSAQPDDRPRMLDDNEAPATPPDADADDERLLQCYVWSGKQGALRDNVVRSGKNSVDVFIGPLEVGAIVGPAAPDDLLGFALGVNEVTVTVVLTPLRAGAKPVSKPLVIPRIGRSADARLSFRIPAGATELRSQLMVLAGNRVIQSAVLVAKVGKKARLTERLVLWPRPADVESRVRFDGAAVATATPSGPALVTHADGVTTIEALPEVTAALTRVRHLVATASQEEAATAELAASLDRRLLIDIAVEGNDLYSQISDRLGPLASAQRIQLVTSRAGAYLPLELMYDRPAPDPDAKLCQTWIDGGTCGPACFASPHDTSVICPHVFWGLSRTIERHQAPLEGTAVARLFADKPTTRTPLALGRAVVAASQLVDDSDIAAVAAAFGTKAVRAATWGEWQTALSAEPTPLLVLMPHNDDAQGALEVAGEFLRRGRIEAPFVTGGHAGLAPAVVLLGCDTAGSQSDPAGYATRFMACGAGVVFSTFTPVLASDAAQVARRLASALVDEQRPEMPAADVLRAVRAAAIRDGFPVALAVTAYGDADWTV